MTVQNAIDMTREVMNAVGSGQWSDTTLQAWCGLAHWQIYANLLNANPYYRMQQVTVTQDSNGQFALSALTTGTGDTKKYFYRIRTVAQPSTPIAQVQFYYRKVNYEDFPNPQPNTSLPYVYYRFGDQFQVLPVTSGQQLVVTVSWRPPNPNQLSGTGITIDFPEGYEPLIPWRACQLALVKGGSETQAARDIQAKADVMEQQMLQDLGRETLWPTVARSFDLPEDWGA